MFVKRNRTRHGGQGYQSVLLVQGKRVPAKPSRRRADAAYRGGPEPPAAADLIYARLAFQRSRLSAIRAAEDHAVREVLRVGRFDEDDLNDALDYLAEQQEVIETALAPQPAPGAVFLYDVTSVYFAGEQNELAAFGDNRDGKRANDREWSGG